MKIVDKETGQEQLKEVTAAHDEGIRPGTTYESVSQIKPAIENGVIAAAKVVLGAVGPRMIIAHAAADCLIGTKLGENILSSFSCAFLFCSNSLVFKSSFKASFLASSIKESLLR